MSEVIEMKLKYPTKMKSSSSSSSSAEMAETTPQFQIENSPPLINMLDSNPKSPFSHILMSTSPNNLGSPMKKVITSMQSYLEEVGHFTKLDPQEAWLPITECRNGNAYYAAFHTLCSGIGFQALLLPLALTVLGWTWGIMSLSVGFVWQLYTLWLLIQLHESDSGMRCSRYLQLSMNAFGEKLGKVLTLFPIMYLSGGTCVTLIMIGGGTMKMIFQLFCGNTCNVKLLTTIEWYLIFTCSAIIIAQLPNLNSIAGVSLIGSITAVSYCTLIWVVSICKGRSFGVSYQPVEAKSDVASVIEILNALGIIAFAFRGHNLVLEIQGTMPSNIKSPSHLPMWKGVKFAYLIISMCLFPLTIGGYWAYGNSGLKVDWACTPRPNYFCDWMWQIPSKGGMLNALYKYHREDTSKLLLGLACMLVVINSLCSFQIYAMPVFDNLEFRYTSIKNKPCTRWLRIGLRIFFGCLAFFIAVALPFLESLAGLLGGVALPLTLAYPSFMWILLKKPTKYSITWALNWFLGILGMVLSIPVITGAIWTLVTMGIEVHFFKPQ